MIKYLWLIFGLLVFLILPKMVTACSCDLPVQGKSVRQQVIDARLKAEAVFVGKVLSVESPADMLYKKITLEVRDEWKGANVQKVTILTGRGGGDCGYEFEVGGTYLVYAYGDNHTYLGTNICQRTAVYQNDLADLKFLGKPRSHRRSAPASTS